MNEKKYNLIIVGSGPAGMTASIYLSRFGLNHLMIGSLIDGRMAEAHKVGNFPSEEEIKGEDLVKKMENSASKLGAEIISDKVVKISRQEDSFLLETITGQKYFSENILLAMGAERQKLNISGENEFFGKGVSYCATCDGKLFTDKIVAVIGGSSAAATTADYLAEIAKKVYLIHESELKADKIWQKKVKSNPKIELVLENKITELKGNDFLEEAVLEKEHQGKNNLALDGIFVEMGIAPHLEMAEELNLDKDQNGFIKIDSGGSTNVKGVWAAGDITNGSNNFRQIITACAEGAIAASSIFAYLKQNK